ncbi:hypothetical protein [Shewanella morhuae]|uniref:Uncharacterized protein n=1 Tax=Shewanella morhuae TaxID=365591 RepID=A0A380C0C0_9GAMM|nr:hypothetical protein [Shewanella morhuae]SUJ10489.1 Uncharacterised protein [Shewanella morhuae]
MNHELIETQFVDLATQIPTLTVANLAYKYQLLEQAYKQVSEQWHIDSINYQIVESLFHLSLLARRERVHPVYANMPVLEWTKSPSHTQTLCWLNQLNNCIRKVSA